MSQLINGIKVPFVPIVKPEHPVSNVTEGKSSFDSIFQREFEKIKFSNKIGSRINFNFVLYK